MSLIRAATVKNTNNKVDNNSAQCYTCVHDINPSYECSRRVVCAPRVLLMQILSVWASRLSCSHAPDFNYQWKIEGTISFFPDPTQAADHRFLFSPPRVRLFSCSFAFLTIPETSQPRGSSNLTLVIVLGVFFRRCKTSAVIQGSFNTRAPDSVLPPMSIHAAAFILFCLIFRSLNASVQSPGLALRISFSFFPRHLI